MNVLRIVIELISWQLGTIPLSEVSQNWLNAKAAEDGAPASKLAEEAKQLETPDFDMSDELKKITTGFWRRVGHIDQVVISNHMIKGFLKEAAWAVRRIGGTETKKVTAYLKAITSLVFVEPRFISLNIPEGQHVLPVVMNLGLDKAGEVVDQATIPDNGWEFTDGSLLMNERGLRVQTPKGERTCLSRSEMVPPGTTMAFDLQIMDKKLIPSICELLEYGAFKGLGQWRSGGNGSFAVKSAELVEAESPFGKLHNLIQTGGKEAATA